MRVTKTIRDFVERQVNLKMEQSVSLTELKRKADETEQKYMQEIKSVQREYQEKLRNICSKYGINTEGIRTSYVDYPGKYYLPEVEQYQNLQCELRKKRDLAIMDILATMELGGTKAELMEMINNLEF